MRENQLLADKLDQKRTRLLILNLIGYGLGYGGWIIRTYFLTGSSHSFLTPFILIGTLIFMIASYQLWRFQGQLKKHAQVARILNDEWIVSVRVKAWTVGLVAVTLLQMLILLISLFHPFSSRIAAEISIFVVVVSCHCAFLYYHR